MSTHVRFSISRMRDVLSQYRCGTTTCVVYSTICGLYVHQSCLRDCLVQYSMILYKFLRKDTARQSQVTEEFINLGRFTSLVHVGGWVLLKQHIE